MNNKQVCVDCHVELTNDEIALSKKMLGRGGNPVYFCLKCLAEYLDCKLPDLQIKIMEFKEQGCTMFL